MRKIILCLAVSFDGFIEGPNGEIDWIVFDAEGGSDLTALLEEIDTVLYGRVSYEMWGNPPLTENSSAFEKHFYGALRQIDRYVFSQSKDEFEGDPLVVRSEIPAFVQKLKQQPGKHIWLYGGASLITTFMNHDLVDEFRIAVMPVILGQGKPLFQDIEHRLRLRLIEVKTSQAGVLAVRYEAVRENAPA
jgi:dihydrofolate reductase